MFSKASLMCAAHELQVMPPIFRLIMHLFLHSIFIGNAYAPVHYGERRKAGCTAHCGDHAAKCAGLIGNAGNQAHENVPGSISDYLTLEGYPASSVASVSFSTLVFASSKVTTASCLSRLTSVFVTPSTWVSAFLTVIGQAGQFMPGTDNVTVRVAAQAGVKDEVMMAARARQGNGFFMLIPDQ